ncbi:MAG: 2-dehydropantoate 2-reductase [Opitutales bacterium]
MQTGASAGKPRIGIVGTGAIGGFYGAMLARAGQDVHFLCRGDYEAVRQHGLRVTRIDTEDFTLPQVQAYNAAQEIGRCDLVIVTLKATSNAALPVILQPLVGPETTLLTLQNGMGNVEFLSQLYPDNPVMGGLCFVCVNRTSPGVFENTIPKSGYVVLGAHRHASLRDTEAVAALFCAAEVNARARPSLDEALWRKLCWNVPFNGLCIAGGGVTTDIIMASERLKYLARWLMEDLRDAAARHGHTIEDAFLQKQFDATAVMGAYRPSSLIDFLEKRPVEVEAIFGVPLRRGLEAGAALPHLRTLYPVLRARCG